MTAHDIFAFFRQKFGTIILFGALVAALSFFLLMVTEKRFQTSTDFLVVQTSGNSQDFYSQFKSSEYLGKILAESIFSERFIDAIVETGKVQSEFLPLDKKDRLEKWQKMVKVEKNLELGIIGVTVKSGSERDASRVMQGIAEVLTQRNMLFRGGDEKSVEIRILSGPITERNPTVGKIASVVGSGFLAGLLVTTFILIVRNETKRKKEEEASEIFTSDTLA